jgi:transposase-like protein
MARRATAEERAACVAEAVELMAAGERMYRAADLVSAESGWARNTIIDWLRTDAPRESTMLRAAQVPARVAELERENARLREALRVARIEEG